MSGKLRVMFPLGRHLGPSPDFSALGSVMNTGLELRAAPMRWLLVGVLLAAAVPAVARNVNDQVDRITGARTITYAADGSTDLAQPVLTFQVQFEAETPSSMVSLAFVSQDEGSGVPAPRFARCHGIEWFADGQPVATAPASHQGRAVDGEMVELIDQEVATTWVLSIAAAGAVRYRVCRNDYTLTANDLGAFATIAAKLKGATYSRTGRAAPVENPAAQPVVDYQGMNWRPKNPDTMFPKRR